MARKDEEACWRMEMWDHCDSGRATRARHCVIRNDCADVARPGCMRAQMPALASGGCCWCARRPYREYGVDCTLCCNVDACLACSTCHLRFRRGSDVYQGLSCTDKGRSGMDGGRRAVEGQKDCGQQRGVDAGGIDCLVRGQCKSKRLR